MRKESIVIPFKYGSVVSGNDFCGRKNSINELKEFIKSSQNVYIQGERRIGKTSLVYETVLQLKKISLLKVDLLSVKTANEFVRRVLQSIGGLKAEQNVLLQILQNLSHLKPVLSVDPVTNLPAISVEKSMEITAESVEQIFDLLGTIAERNRVVVFFDEFQDIIKIDEFDNIISIIRSKIQYLSAVPFIFAGSIRNNMDSIFMDPASPLYKAALRIELGPIDKREFTPFIAEKFLTGKRILEEGIIDELFSVTDGISGDIQQFCEALWSVTSYRDKITMEHLKEARNLIFAREGKSYEYITAQLTAIQLSCLTGLAKAGGSEPTSSKFLEITGISQPSSVVRALQKLVDSQLVFRTTEGYRFVNPFLREWLIRRY
jgi:uncharacterized protein